jgi:hypothetical protein
MKYANITLLFVIFSSFCSLIQGQVVISDEGYNSPDSSAILELKSNTKGFLLPKMTLNQRTAINNPAEGLMVNCTNCGSDGTPVISVYIMGSWKNFFVCVPPQIPTEATHVAGYSEIAWKWHKVPGAMGYIWSTSSETFDVDLGTDTSYTEINLACASDYSRYVWAYNDCGLSTVLNLNESTLETTFSLAPAEAEHVPDGTMILWKWHPVSQSCNYKWNTTNNYQTATDLGPDTSYLEYNLLCLTEYTRYVWAYCDCNYSETPTMLAESTLACWSCGDSITVFHIADSVAPVTKTVTYGTIGNIPGEPSKCWITNNLGSNHQALAKDDTTEASSGWYWQFNREQGYKYNGSQRTPSTSWVNTINEFFNWVPANDPCALELGSGWRVPLGTEWINLDAGGSWTNWLGPWGSALKIHAAGKLDYNTGILSDRGVKGLYWSSEQIALITWAQALSFSSSSCTITQYQKAYGYAVRCLKN